MSHCVFIWLVRVIVCRKYEAEKAEKAKLVEEKLNKRGNTLSLQRGASLPLTPEDEEYNRMMAAPIVKVVPTRGPPPTPERHTTRAEPVLEEQFTGFDTIKKGMTLAPQADAPYYDGSSSSDPVVSLNAGNKTSTIVSVRPDTIQEEETNDDEFTFSAPSKPSVPAHAAAAPAVGISKI